MQTFEYKKNADGRYVISVANRQEIVEVLTAFCEQTGVRSGIVGGIAAVNEVVFRYLDPVTMKYVDKAFNEQMEVTCLTGNISQKDGKPYLHLHMTCSRSDYSCVGGHLLSARINGACELFVEDYGIEGIGRRLDPQTGLNLYDFC